MKRIPNFALIALLVAISLASCDSLLSSKMENPISDRDSIQLALDSLTPELQLIWLAERIAVDSVTDTLEIIYPHWYVHQLAQNYELLNVDNYDSVLNIANWSARYVQFGDTIQQYPEFYKYAALNSAKRRAFELCFQHAMIWIPHSLTMVRIMQSAIAPFLMN
ncbi:hypothetical protein N8Z47_06770 [Salibacteraceae bacterium]|nr:hypothetical protein [Salibacteraceae bacterium]